MAARHGAFFVEEGIRLKLGAVPAQERVLQWLDNARLASSVDIAQRVIKLCCKGGNGKETLISRLVSTGYKLF